MYKLTHHNKIPKFIEIFYNFSLKEQKSFTKLAVSSYFNKKRNHKPLINTLKKLKSQYFSDSEFDIIEQLQSSLKIKKRALWNRFSELTKIAEYFFLLSGLDDNKLERKKILLGIYSERKLNDRLRLEIVPSLKLINSTKLDLNTYFSINSIYGNFSSYYSEQNNNNESAKYNDLQSEYSLLHFLLTLFKQLLDAELRERNNISNEFNLSKEFITSIDHIRLLEIVGKRYPKESIPVKIYYNLYMSFKDAEGEKYYYNAKEIFLLNKDLFSSDFKNNIYQSLRNYCIEKTNIGDAEYYKEIFQLNNSILEEGLFKDLNVVNSRTNNFRNFIFAALRLKEFDWIKKFIEDHSIELPDDIRMDEVNLNSGVLKIYEKEYNAALTFLKKVKRKKYLQYLDTSVYKLIIFYETGEIEEAYSETARLKDYIRKHKEIPAYLKTGYQRFIKKFESLLKISQKTDLTEIEFYLVQMESFKNVGLGSWLYEKGIELLNKSSKRH